jgi:hypothetical protein
MLDGVALSRVWRIPGLLRLEIVFHSLFEYMPRRRLNDRLSLEKSVPECSATAMLGEVVDPAASFRPQGEPVKAIEGPERGEHGEPDQRVFHAGPRIR